MMMKKKNLLPDMQVISLANRDGSTVEMELATVLSNNRVYMFISDTHQLGESKLAKDAVFYIQQLVDRYRLDGDKTEFYRHIYNESMGSVFGRFTVYWNEGQDATYRFQMLTNVDDMIGIKRVLADGNPIAITTKESKQATA